MRKDRAAVGALSRRARAAAAGIGALAGADVAGGGRSPGKTVRRPFRGCFRPGVMTFEKFAETVLHAAGLPIRPITRLMKRELVRQIIDEQSATGPAQAFPVDRQDRRTGRFGVRVHQRVEAAGDLARGVPSRLLGARHRPTRTSNCPRSTRPISRRCGSTACSTPKGGSGRPGTYCGSEGKGRRGEERGEGEGREKQQESEFMKLLSTIIILPPRLISAS